jgi:hypothetical protein
VRPSAHATPGKLPKHCIAIIGQALLGEANGFADGGYFDNSGLFSASDWLLVARSSIHRKVLLVVIEPI